MGWFDLPTMPDGYLTSRDFSWLKILSTPTEDTLTAAEIALDELETKWGDKYPMVTKSWRSKWPTLSIYFEYPDYVRMAIYITNALETAHR